MNQIKHFVNIVVTLAKVRRKHNFPLILSGIKTGNKRQAGEREETDFQTNKTFKPGRFHQKQKFFPLQRMLFEHMSGHRVSCQCHFVERLS